MKTLTGLGLVFLPWLDSLHQQLAAVPDGVLPPQVKLIVSGLGLLLAAYGRLVAKGPLLK